MFSRRADEAYKLAQEAKAEASVAVTEIRGHSAFCVLNNERRDAQHAQNLRALEAVEAAVANLRAWVVMLLLSIAGAIILGLVAAVVWLVVHFVILPTSAHAATHLNWF